MIRALLLGGPKKPGPIDPWGMRLPLAGALAALVALVAARILNPVM